VRPAVDTDSGHAAALLREFGDVVHAGRPLAGLEPAVLAGRIRGVVEIDSIALEP
jgi:hypothetical protein